MKGTIFDFLKLAAEKPEVARELAELAAKHGIEFSDEVSDDELEKVAGGGLFQFEVQQGQQVTTQAMKMYANLAKSWNETAQTIIKNLKP